MPRPQTHHPGVPLHGLARPHHEFMADIFLSYSEKDRTLARLLADHRCSLGLGTSAASRCMSTSANITKCAVPSHRGVFNFSSICPAKLVARAHWPDPGA